MYCDILSEKTNILYCSIECAKKEEPFTPEDYFRERSSYSSDDAINWEALSIMFSNQLSFVCGSVLYGSVEKEYRTYLVGLGNPYGVLCSACGNSYGSA